MLAHSRQLLGVLFLLVLGFTESRAVASDHPYCLSSGLTSTNCASPGPNEVVVYADSDRGGLCITFSTAFLDPVRAPSAPAGYIPDLSVYGFNDCISSIQVGSKTRLMAYVDNNYSSKVATYEPGYYTGDQLGVSVNDNITALKLENRPITGTKEPLPFRFLGNYPNHDGAYWRMEAQGLAHDRDAWYVTDEAWLPGSHVFYDPSVKPPANCGFTGVCEDFCDGVNLMDYYCFAPGVPYSAGFVDAVAADHNFTGVVWRIPFGTDVNAPFGSSITTRQLYQIPQALNADLGYRHFGDSDATVIDGKTYLLIPVQGDKGHFDDGTPRFPLPYVLVLDDQLNFYANWTLPPSAGYAKDDVNDPRHNGTGSYLAIRPGKDTVDPVTKIHTIELWMGMDLQNGNGIERFSAQVVPNSQEMKLLVPGPVLIRDPNTPYAKPMTANAGQGGVFSPSGRTFYYTRGGAGGFLTTCNYGNIHAFDADSGEELTFSGNNFGLFNFQQEDGTFGCSQEPEGLDFFDTRCASVTIPGNSGFGAGQSSQLHVFLLDNGIENEDDAIWLKHYSLATGVQPMCDAWTEWTQGYVASTGQSYPYGFNVFAFGPVSGLQHVEGSVAAAGTVNLTSFGLNSSKTQPIGVIANGALTLSNGTIAGAIYSGSTRNISSNVTYDANEVAAGSPIDFDKARTTLRGLSQTLAARSANGVVSFPSGSSNIVLTGTDPKLNVFLVSGTTLLNVYSYTLNVPAGSTTIVNVTGTSVRIANAGFSLNGQDAHKILWNFNQATSLELTSVGFSGSVLATEAQATLNWGSLSGTLVAASVKSTSEMYYVPFNGRW